MRSLILIVATLLGFAVAAPDARGGSSVPPPADCDNSGMVNLRDFALFAEFFRGPVEGSAGRCRCFDIDDSRSVDLRDFAALQVAFGRSLAPAEPAPRNLFVLQLAEYHDHCKEGDGGDRHCQIGDPCCLVSSGSPDEPCALLADSWVATCDLNADGERDFLANVDTLGEWNDLLWEPDDTCNVLARDHYQRGMTDGPYERHFIPMCTDGSTPPEGTTTCPDGQPIIQCTDGTRPLFHYLPGTSDRWIILVQSGGNACAASSCWETEDRGHYSSAWGANGPTASSAGMFKPYQDSPFAAYNRIIVDKCVGDRNCGSSTLTDVDFIAPDGTPKGTGTVYFHGYRELQALLKHLSVWDEPHKLTTTSQIAFATHSNGSNGLYMYIDRLAEYIRHDSSDGQPGLGLVDADVRGLASSYVRPSVEAENLVNDPAQNIFAWRDYDPFEFDGHITAPLSTAGEGAANGLWYSTLVYYSGIEFLWHRNWGAVLFDTNFTTLDGMVDVGTIDESCFRAHGLYGGPGHGIEACLDSMHVLMNHVTTPVFLAPQLYDHRLRVTPLLNYTKMTNSFFDLGYTPDAGSVCGSHDENFGCVEASQCAEGELPCEMRHTKDAEYDAVDFSLRVRAVARGAVDRSTGMPEETPIGVGAPVGHAVFAPEWAAHDGWTKPDKTDYQICDDTDLGGCAWQSVPLWAAVISWLEYDATVICVERDLPGVDANRPLTNWSETTPGPLLDDRCGALTD